MLESKKIRFIIKFFFMFKMQTQSNQKAFTLVELIVVIVILAILATIAFLSFSSQSASARDSTRLSDMSNIAK
jgi:prepilin-type N-terminal cleavage/methylation domain-containing protein